MALKKEIILQNGVTMNYHRISEIQNVVNGKTTLVIYSYINEEQREREKNHKIMYSDDIYKIADYMYLDYNDTLTIKEAYEYLKTTDKYKDSEDIFEESDIKNDDSNYNSNVDNQEDEVIEQDNVSTNEVDLDGKIDE